jgi:hypothetical protein
MACGSSTPGGPAASAAGSSSGGTGGEVAGGGGLAGGSAGSGGTAGSGTPAAGSGGTVAPSGGAGAGGGGQASGGESSQTPPEGVPPAYKLVYEQSFADPSSLGDLVFGNPTQWEHDAAGFIASTGASYAPPYRSPFSVALVKSIQVESFVMDLEMLQTSPDGDAHRDMVMIWSLVSPSEFYYAHVSTAHDGVAHNILIVNNADRTAISDTFSQGYDWGRDVWKRLRVVHDVATGDMAVYDLDMPATAILTANDTTFQGGYVGFGSFDNSGRVRNVKVWAAASTPGDPGFFSPAQ